MAKPGRPKKAQGKEIITRSTSIDNMMMQVNLLDPDRVLEKLGVDPEIAFRDMMADDHLTAVMGTRQASIKGMSWDLTVGKSSDRILKATQEVLENLNMRQQGAGVQGMGMPRFFDDILQANPWGMSPLEVVWQTGINEWIPLEVKGKPFRYFTFDNDNKLLFRTSSNWEGEAIPDKKVLLARHWITSSSFDNPYGDKLLSKSYWPVFWKRNGIQFWNVYLEKYGMPWVVAKVNPNMGENDREALAEDMVNMVQDGAIVLPNTSEIELMDSSGKSSQSDLYEKMLTFNDNALSKVWLGQTLTTQLGDVGSYAASKTHEGVKDERRNQDKKMVESTVQTLIDWFVELNFGLAPSPEFRLIEPLGVNQELATRDKTLTETGIKFTPEYYQRKYGLEEDEFEIKEEAEPVASVEGEFSKAKTPADQLAIDNMLASLDPVELQKQLNGILKPVIKLINNGADYNEVLKKLTSVHDDMDSEMLELELTKAYNLADTIGRLSDAGN